MNRPLVVAASLLTLCAFAPSLHGQGVQTGTLRGAIADPQDRTVSGATITISSGALQGQRTSTSDQDGNFVFTALPPGRIGWKFTMPSFASVERTVTIPLGGTIELQRAVAPGRRRRTGAGRRGPPGSSRQPRRSD